MTSGGLATLRAIDSHFCPSLFSSPLPFPTPLPLQLPSLRRRPLENSEGVWGSAVACESHLGHIPGGI